jgi:N-hydroxyarylamine O-acetyltransferase
MIDRYLARIGLDGSDTSLETLHRAHVCSVPFENLEIPLGRPVLLDIPSLVAKIVDGGRGGYCFELNGLYAVFLEELGYNVSPRLGRVRMSDPNAPRAATHMTLVVDDQVIDVGFGAANPLGPIPLGEEATFGPYTWRTRRVTAPEGDEVWLVSLFDKPLYTFSDMQVHPVDYVIPNHFTSTHELSSFTHVVMAQRWQDDNVHVGITGFDLVERGPDGEATTKIEASDYGNALLERFGLSLASEEIERLVAFIAG